MKIHKIHPADLAAMNVERAGQKYQPSNGTEGECFISVWCGECARDKSLREGAPFEECDDNERCDIVTKTMVYDVKDSEYPHEWQYGPDGQPRCTAFVEAGTPIPPPKDDRTMDMFGDPS
jgi:hypothetical protein